MRVNMREEGDVDARDDVRDAEEDGAHGLSDEMEDGEEGFMAFNLDQERKEGYFDDDGNYVEYAEEKDETDLWMDKDGKVDERLASGAIKRSTAALEEEEGAQEMSARDVAEMQIEIAGYLHAGETVLGALKRLSRKPDGNKRGGSGGDGRGAKVKQGTTAMTVEEKRAFDRLTELSSALMGNGEYEVYTFRKEAFERAAALFAPVTTSAVDETGADDMFADSDDEEDTKPHTEEPSATKRAVVEEEPNRVSSSVVDFHSMSIKQLKAYVEAHGGNVKGSIAEKSELIDRARACQSNRNHIPEGYTWNLEKGTYYSEASDLCFNPTTNLFTDDTKFWYYDQSQGGFVEWTG